MNILIVGSGAREHAIARALHNSPKLKTLYCLASNNNPGLRNLCFDMQVTDINNNETILQYARENNIYLAIIGPEKPLASGVSDVLAESGIRVVGPTKEHSKIESSKSFARDLLLEHKIPVCPKYRVFDSIKGVQKFLNNQLAGVYYATGQQINGGELPYHFVYLSI